ncbi:MAG: restriction endonuclease [Alphaproteobacteria bacterium]|nr:MAG: restriction endonuclease [Alphaproteobacteria bacterium]
MTLPPYVTREFVKKRLEQIFPEGAQNRMYCTRDIAGATVFAMLYVGAVDGQSYLLPKQVFRMSDDQAKLTSDAARAEYAKESTKPGFVPRSQAWYADNTRESIRDETIRQGLMPVGAVVVRKDLPTTSAKPRYALAGDFAALFDPGLAGTPLDEAIEQWRGQHLTPAALARISLVHSGAGKSSAGVLVEFPNQETRRLTAGTSSQIAKGVVERFAPSFLENPAVLWLSESGKKVVERDDILAKKIGLHIDPSRNLPDIILVDLGPKDSSSVLVVFVEVVATDGPVTEERRAELMKLTEAAGFAPTQVAFVTAFLDRGHAAMRKSFQAVAWNSFVWIASEPDKLIALNGTSGVRLPRLLKTMLNRD